MYKLLFLTSVFVAASLVNGYTQISFSDGSHQLSSQNAVSAVPVAISDMNNDLLDDIIHLDQGTNLVIAYQQADGSFDALSLGKIVAQYQWTISIADVDRNGYKDIIVGGLQDNIQLFKASIDGSSFSQSTIFEEFIIQGSNFVDIDNDGDVDLFANSDFDHNRIFENDGQGNFTMNNNLIQTNQAAGNYSSIWTDYDNDGDVDMYSSKCFASSNDRNSDERLNRLYQNDGQGNYSDVSAIAGVQIGLQSWASDFGDIDNDGDLDFFLVNHSAKSQLFQNNGNGTFTEITTESGISSDITKVDLQASFRDFDNDTYLDLIIGGQGETLYHNDGDGTFTKVNSPFINTSSSLNSYALGDLNDDGYVDIYATYPILRINQGLTIGVATEPDQLLLNSGGDNHYINIALKGGTSNPNGIGAQIRISGPWGKQLREIRSGEAYGIMNSLTAHFGLGGASIVDTVEVTWPSGDKTTLVNVAADQNLLINESVPVGLAKTPERKHSALWPNPNGNKLNIDLSMFNYEVTLNIFNNQGKKVRTEHVKGGTSTQLAHKLPPGLYTLEVLSHKQHFAQIFQVR